MRSMAKERTVGAIRCVITAVARYLRKSISKLDPEHKMAVNLMKLIVNDDLYLHSRVVQVKPLLTNNSQQQKSRLGNCCLD
jgi:hypothetical protein